MKRLISLLLLSFACTIFQAFGTEYDPLLAIIIMVKNEEPVIVETLEPYVKAGIKSFLVLDTGSTDNTIARISSYFKEHAVDNAHIIQEPFIDFAASRNRALDLAHEYFPHAGYFLMVDAEWYMKNVEKLIEFCKAEAAHNKQTPLYLVHIGNETTDFGTARLFKASATHIRFVGRVHECANFVATQTVPADAYFYWNPSNIGQEKSRLRWKRDLALLLQDYADDCKNPRTVFYLAQTYECLGDNRMAAHYYKERAELNIIPEETFMAWYRLGNVTEGLIQQGSTCWKDALDYYLKAYAYRPCRAEPLIRIAKHYIQEDNHQLCYIFSRLACEIAYPANDYLFIDKELYDYERWEILSRCCSWTGRYDQAEDAALKAIAARPEYPHLHTNLQIIRYQKAGVAAA